jgi:hypothetical protein
VDIRGPLALFDFDDVDKADPTVIAFVAIIAKGLLGDGCLEKDRGENWKLVLQLSREQPRSASSLLGYYEYACRDLRSGCISHVNCASQDGQKFRRRVAQQD